MADANSLRMSTDQAKESSGCPRSEGGSTNLFETQDGAGPKSVISEDDSMYETTLVSYEAA